MVEKRRDPWGFTELVGHYTGHLVLLPIAREKAAALLPGRLRLGEQSLTAPSLHPLLIWFGRQRDVHLTRLRRLPGFPLDYLEVIGGVPFVHPVGANTGHTAPSLNLAQLYLDGPLAILGGVTIWGFPKKLARMKAGAERFEVVSPARGAPLLRCEAEVSGPPGPLTRFPYARAFAEILAQPLLQGAMGNQGPTLSSIFQWNLSEAVARPTRARLQLFERFLPGLAGEYVTPAVDEAPLGAIHLESHWRLSLPQVPSSTHSPAPGD